MNEDRSVHAFIFCWPGWEEATHRIAEAMANHVDHLTVLYKNQTDERESGPGDWRKIPSDCFYGWQFRESLGLNCGDIMLHVQADASYKDWPELVAHCRAAFAKIPDIGVWSPDVYRSGFTPRVVQVAQQRTDGLVNVCLTDGIVWAVPVSVIEDLKRLDYSQNNLGWGVMLAAAAIAITRNMPVFMDLSLNVVHPKGTGYNKAEAEDQETIFLKQLSIAQQSYIYTAKGLYKLRRKLRVKATELSFWKEVRKKLSTP